MLSNGDITKHNYIYEMPYIECIHYMNYLVIKNQRQEKIDRQIEFERRIQEKNR